MSIFNITVWICFVFLGLFHMIPCQSCSPKHFGYDSNVCVCNSTYCDFTSLPPKVEQNSYITYTSSREGARFEFNSGSFDTKDNNKNEYNIQITREYLTDQPILGFGGAFTDAAGINIKSLSNTTQDMLMRSYFSPDGISYNFGRVPIGGCDFSTRAYTYADDPNDINLDKFNLSLEDYRYKIPLIHKANQLREDSLSLIGSAWSAPAWMKTNNALTGQGELKTKYYQTWAQYMILFLNYYAKENLKFWAITTGNEPINGELPSFLPFVPKFNSMGWKPNSAAYWITKNLGPTLRSSQHNDTKILGIDDQRLVLPWWLDQMVGSDNNVVTFLDGIGVHWYWDQLISVTVLDKIHRKYPNFLLLNTEASIGDKPWDLVKVNLGSWGRAELYIADIIENFNHGLIAWLEWNLALNERGGPNWKNNFVDAPIIVNPDKDEFYKQPTFYAIGHFSKFIKPGSRVLKVETNKMAVQVLATIDGKMKTIVVVLFNSKNKSINVTVQDENRRSVILSLAKHSLVTLIFPV